MIRRIGDHVDFLDYEVRPDGNTEIVDIAVNSKRRTGRGTELVKELIGRRPKTNWVFAITRAENRIAQSFYASLAFQVMAYLRDFYGDREDAIVYGIRRGETQL